MLWTLPITKIVLQPARELQTKNPTRKQRLQEAMKNRMIQQRKQCKLKKTNFKISYYDSRK